MSKKYAIFIVLLLCSTLVLSSCSNTLTSFREFFNKDSEATADNLLMDEPVEILPSLSEVSSVQPENTRATIMYYKDHDDMLVPVMRYIPKQDLGIAKAAVNGLVYSIESAEELKSSGLKPSLPMGSKINGAVIKDDGLAIIDFSEEFLTFSSKKAEEIGIKAVIYTLTEFPNISSVQIRVNSRQINEMPLGTALSEKMERSDINLQASENSDDNVSKVMVYYQKKGQGEYSYYVPVTKTISGYTNSVEAALNALLQSPNYESGMISPFPQGTELLGVQVKHGVAYINFSQDIIAKNEDRIAVNDMIKSITLTLKDFSVISKAKLFVDGKSLDYTDGIGADEYLDVPVFVNFYN